MDLTECAWCGAEIDGPAIRDKGLVFCSEECHAEWVAEETLDDEDLPLEDLDVDLPDDLDGDLDPLVGDLGDDLPLDDDL